MKCFVCDKPAVLWCRNDEAALCQACDLAVHAVGPLAWKHTRVPLHKPGAATDVKTLSSDQQYNGSGLDTLREQTGSQMSNAVQDDIGVNFEALVDIFPSCQGSGPRSWEVNDLSPTLQGEETGFLPCPSSTLDQLLDSVSDGQGRHGEHAQHGQQSQHAQHAYPCHLTQLVAPDKSALSKLRPGQQPQLLPAGSAGQSGDASFAPDMAPHASKQSSATTIHGTAAESALSNALGGRTHAGQTVTSVDRVCRSPAPEQHAHGPMFVPTAYDGGQHAPGSGPYPVMRAGGAAGEPRPLGVLLRRSQLRGGLATQLNPGALLSRTAVAPHTPLHSLLPPPGDGGQQEPWWALQQRGGGSGTGEDAADAAAAKAAAITAALPHALAPSPSSAACMPCMQPTAGAGGGLHSCMQYIPMTLRPQRASDCAAAQARRARQRARFAEKKRRLGSGQAVRYQSRKRYADSRPRVNGRFIRKADLETSAGGGGPAFTGTMHAAGAHRAALHMHGHPHGGWM